MILTMVFGIIGGLGLFFFGMHQLSEGLQRIAGHKIHDILEALSKNPLNGVLAGTIITSIIQSSSATSVILIGFANAGLLNLNQSMSIIFGANIGTTITSQIVSLRLEDYVLPIVGIGVIFYLFTKKKIYQNIGYIMLGFGLLFLGISIMSQFLEPLKNYPYIIDLLVKVGEYPLLGILLSALLTGIIQSSSATMAIIISLSLQGLIDLNAAVPLILGANIGTCVTALIAGIGSSLTGKRIAVGHILCKIAGVVLFYFFLKQFTVLSSLTSNALPRQIANAHTIFNLLETFILLPFIPQITKFLNKIVPGEDHVIKKGNLYLERRFINAPSIAMGQVAKELVRMGDIASVMLKNTLEALVDNNERMVEDIYLKEDILNTIHREITNYLVQVSQKSLSPYQSQRLAHLMNISGHIERVGDHIENITDLADTKINEKLPFSPKAVKDLSYIFSKVETSFKYAMRALKKNDADIAAIVTKREDEIDRIEAQLRDEHIDRLTKGICNTESGIIYIDILSNLERIADHANNISRMILDEQVANRKPLNQNKM
ncbi:MAG: Na/Pi cotransporter family protein [Candidatus Atribacteria bacterium]|jgi:phosphate:Na+ symporter|nr:Na/Pi cotransporter family protein [Candidatus Atribacteria bacterium]